MSTRCQVRVTNGEDKLTLYHHYDGYPTNMLRLIKEAWEKYGKGWEGARVGKVAGMLCAIDPVIFEPEDTHELHGDIEYFYEVNCKGEQHVGSEPIWEVTTYEVKMDFDNKKSEKERLTRLKTVPVDKITDEVAEEIQGVEEEE